MTKNFYAPDDNDWVDLGPSLKRFWPWGIPSVIVTPEGEFLYKEYAGHVWRRNVRFSKMDSETDPKRSE